MKKSLFLITLYILSVSFFFTIDQSALAVLAVSDRQVISVDFSHIKNISNNKIVLEDKDRDKEYLISKKDSQEILQTISQCRGNIILSIDIDKNEIESADCQSKKQAYY